MTLHNLTTDFQHWFRQLNRIEKALMTLLLLGLFTYLLFFIVHASACLLYPYDLDNEEGFILNQTVRLSHGQTIYPDLKSYPYTVGNYPPLHPLLGVPLTWIFGPVHLGGRLISILATLLLCGVAGRWVYRLTSGDWGAALFTALFPFGIHYFYLWGVYNRVDMLGLALCFWGMYLFYRNPEKLFMPALLFTLSLYAKQTLLAAPATVFIYSLIYYRRNAWRLPVYMMAMGLPVFGLLMVMTHGEIYRHLVAYNINPYYVADMINYLTNIQKYYWPILVLALTSFFLTWRQPKEKVLLGIYTVLAFGVMLTAGKEGSAVNYLLEFMLLITILSGVCIGWIKNLNRVKYLIPLVVVILWSLVLQIHQGPFGGWKYLFETLCYLVSVFLSAGILISLGWLAWKKNPQGLLAVLVALLLVQIVLIRHIPYTRYWYGKTPDSRSTSMGQSVERIVRNTPGDILSDDASFLVRNKRPVLFQPFIMTTLARQRLWSLKPVMSDIEKQRFSLIIMYHSLGSDFDYSVYERYTPDMVEAIRTHYQLSDYRDPYYLYTPRTE